MSHRHVRVQTNVAQLVHRLRVFVAQAVHAQHVALDEFATNVGRHKGLAQRRRVARHVPSTGGVADVVVGGAVPAGRRVHPKHQESIVSAHVEVLVLTVELELVNVGTMVQGCFNGQVVPRLGVDRLALDGLGFLVLVREGGGVEVEGAKRLTRIPHARAQRPPFACQPAGITGAQNGGIRVGARSQGAVGPCATRRNAVPRHSARGRLQVRPKIVGHLGPHPRVGSAFCHQQRSVLRARSRSQCHSTGHRARSKGARCASAKHFDPGQILGVHRQVHQMVASMRGAPAHAVHPQSGLFKGAATHTQIGLNPDGAA